MKLKSQFYIFVDNSQARTFNSNIDAPMFFCFAHNKEEAVGKMILSDFSYKYKPITRIDTITWDNKESKEYIAPYEDPFIKNKKLIEEWNKS